MPLAELQDFLALSYALNYTLSDTFRGRYGLLKHITAGNEGLTAQDKKRLMKALDFLIRAYGKRPRKLGPPAVLHPLRTAVLLSRTFPRTTGLVELLAALFHDLIEDVNLIEFERREAMELESTLDELLSELDPGRQEDLAERLALLTRHRKESYYQYISRVLKKGSPSVLAVKLADRLDNTLDMHTGVEEPLEGMDFFQVLFSYLFERREPKDAPGFSHPPPAPINGARRLYQLFKNAVFLSLIRQTEKIQPAGTTHRLLEGLAEAGLREAQRIFVHIVTYHPEDVTDVREALLDAMEYCHGGGAERITPSAGRHALDGLFSGHFDHVNRAERDKKLTDLYQNRPLMLQASVAFVTIFRRFLLQPDFYVQGIGPEGITDA